MVSVTALQNGTGMVNIQDAQNSDKNVESLDPEPAFLDNVNATFCDLLHEQSTCLDFKACCIPPLFAARC